MKLKGILKKGLIIFLVAFFSGRLIIFQNLNPIAPAFLSFISSDGIFFPLGAAGAIIGLLSKTTAANSVKYIIGFLILSGCIIFTERKKINKNPYIKSAYGFISTFIAGIIICVFSNFSVYFFITAVLESLLCFSLSAVMEKGKLERAAVLVGCIICGADLNMGFIYMPVMLSALCVMLCVYYYDLPALGTVVLMLVPSLISGALNPEMLSIFIISAAAAHLSGNKNKFAFSAIYILSSLVISIFIRDYISLSSCVSLLAGAVIFIFARLPQTQKKEENQYSAYIKEIMAEKLRNFSYTFEKLSRIFLSLCDDEKQTDITPIVDEVSKGVCLSCPSREECWEKKFYATYRKIFLMLQTCDKNGIIYNDETETIFNFGCRNIPKLTEIVNKLYEVNRTRLEWVEKMKESRKIVSKQLSAVADSAKRLSASLSLDMIYDNDTTEKIKKALHMEGIKFESVIASQGEKKELIIKLKAFHNCGKCKKIINIASSVTETDMCLACEQCVITDGICTLEIEKENTYRIATGVSDAPKEGNEISGDNFSFMKLPDSKYMLALADGMGSGEKASEESAASIELFENFMNAGFEKATALDIINSVLVLRSSEDRLSTLDLFIFDLKTGIAEFIKTGATATFIKNGNTIERLQASSLPIGILPYVFGETKTRRMKDGDIIIMVSDGVTDSFKDINCFENFIVNLDIKNPQKASEAILKKAEELGSHTDDMTVIVSKIRKAK